MRDKENRRDLVFFLHNRLHHFQLFNGIHIETLFVRVSCGKDYIDDIIDKEMSSPPFYVPTRHIMTIGEQKNLLGIPKERSMEDSSPNSSEVPLSPFCLDGEPATPQTPLTPTFCKRIGEKDSSSPSSFMLNEPSTPTDSRNRSTSMFEAIHPTPFSPSNPTEGEERQSRRHRAFSVHDIILQNQPAEEKEERPAVSVRVNDNE